MIKTFISSIINKMYSSNYKVLHVIDILVAVFILMYIDVNNTLKTRDIHFKFTLLSYGVQKTNLEVCKPRWCWCRRDVYSLNHSWVELGLVCLVTYE
jgi:hypothetical protein